MSGNSTVSLTPKTAELDIPLYTGIEDVLSLLCSLSTSFLRCLMKYKKKDYFSVFKMAT
jgi:hypothetical protein